MAVVSTISCTLKAVPWLKTMMSPGWSSPAGFAGHSPTSSRYMVFLVSFMFNLLISGRLVDLPAKAVTKKRLLCYACYFGAIDLLLKYILPSTDGKIGDWFL